MTKKITSKNIIIIITTLILMGLVVFIVGRSYGFFAYKKEGTTPNIISIKGLVANITANPNALTLNEAEPLYDEDGLAQEPFTFTVTNTSSKPSNFTIKIVNDTERLSACKINEGTQEEAQCPALALSNIRYSYKIGDGEYSTPATLGENNVIDAGTLNQNQTKTYYIKIWINSEATNDIMGKYFFGKIILEGTKIMCNAEPGDTYEFNYTGDVQEFIPSCEGYYSLETWGAEGGSISALSAAGGKGGYSFGTINLSVSDKLYVVVGGAGTGSYNNTESLVYVDGGYNGGGQTGLINRSGYAYYSYGASGGGATHIAINNNLGELKNYENNKSDILIVAGGGGGAGGGQNGNASYAGGAGGGFTGGDGIDYRNDAAGAHGGTQTESGSGRSRGGFGMGVSGNLASSAGGGGWYGGSTGTYGSGGGGSGYIGGVTSGQTVVGNQTITEPNGTSSTGHTGNGYARITYLGEKELLNSTIMNQNTVINTDLSNSIPNMATTATLANDSGFYKMSYSDNGNTKTTYYYRGNIDNNNIKFAGMDWKIIRINEDGTIRLIGVDGINNNATYVFNTNKTDKYKMYYSNSTIKPILDSWYQSTFGNTSYDNMIASGGYFCEQAKAADSQPWIAGTGTSMLPWTSYTPSFACSADENGYGVINSKVGLITFDETFYAGMYGTTEDPNNYLYIPQQSWTMSPAGFASNTALAWVIRAVGRQGNNYVDSGASLLRPVINLKTTVKVVGAGTASNPYIVISE